MILPMTNIINYEHKAIQEQYKKECEITVVAAQSFVLASRRNNNNNSNDYYYLI